MRTRRGDDCPATSAAINILQNRDIGQRLCWCLIDDHLPCGRAGCPAYRVGCVFAVEGRFSLAYSYHCWLPWARQEASPTHKTDTSQSRFESRQLIICFAVDNVKVSVLQSSVPSIREGVSVLLGNPMTTRIQQNQIVSQYFFVIGGRAIACDYCLDNRMN